MKSAEWSNEKHAAQWRSTLHAYASPVFGRVAIADVDIALVMKALTPIWAVKTETATRVRGRIEAVLDWAKVMALRSGENPAQWRGNLDKLLPKPSKVAQTTHFPAIPYREIQPFMKRLAQHEAIAARAMELTIYACTRTGETIGAMWREIDFEKRIWTIPPSRMKSRRAHRVPLSAPAIAVLKTLHATAASPFIFPSPNNTEARHKPLSNMAMLTLLRRMQRTDITTHGMRSAFRDWCAEQTNYPRELAEAALSHVVKDKTEAAYQRGDMLEKRAALMEAWAKHCNTEPIGIATVTPIGNRSIPA